MKIDSVEFFYLAMPEILDIGDGSQDTLLVRVGSGPYEGWGECEASPLVSIAAFVTPMSHSACRPVKDGVLGRRMDSPDDVRTINREVRRLSFDLLQADHTLSGVDMALWDLLGKRFEEPVYRMLGHREALPKRAYASLLFGDTPEETEKKARALRGGSYTAAKFGWGPYGLGSVAEDAAHLEAARAGLGNNIDLLVDAGTVFGEDVDAAAARLPALIDAKVLWFEEPFPGGAVSAYSALAGRIAALGSSEAASRSPAPRLALAGGEGAHNPYQARHLIDSGGIGYVQIDAGRIGGITSAYEVATYARERKCTYVNHTFTTPLAMAASLQPYAGDASSELCEYPVEASAMARKLTKESIPVDTSGFVRMPDGPGLGMTIDQDTVRRYRKDVQISVDGRVLFDSTSLSLRR